MGVMVLKSKEDCIVSEQHFGGLPSGDVERKWLVSVTVSASAGNGSA